MGNPERGGNSHLEAIAQKYQQLVKEYESARERQDVETMARLAPWIQQFEKQLR